MSYDKRLELRVSARLRDKFKSFCTKNNLKESEAGRDAIELFMDFGTFISSLIQHLQDPTFYTSFKRWYKSVPDDLKNILEDLLGKDEQKLVSQTPEALLKSVKVITQRGRAALSKRIGKCHEKTESMKSCEC